MRPFSQGSRQARRREQRLAARAADQADARGLRFEALEPRRLLVGDLELLQDINPALSTSSSNPFKFVEVGSVTFFTAATATHGMELWKSDGTAAGTVLVKDIRAGSASANPAYLTNVGGTLYFSANDGATGDELWKSDGTAAGTMLVKDIGVGSLSASPGSLTYVGGTLYFRANDGATGRELWKSDGTAAGTTLVKDIRAGSASAIPSSLTYVGGRSISSLMMVRRAGSCGRATAPRPAPCRCGSPTIQRYIARVRWPSLGTGSTSPARGPMWAQNCFPSA